MKKALKIGAVAALFATVGLFRTEVSNSQKDIKVQNMEALAQDNPFGASCNGSFYDCSPIQFGKFYNPF
jgi:hypothetical protein